MQIINHGNLSADLIQQIEREISTQQNLQDTMRWALSHTAGRFLAQVVANVIVQDEFTHDVVVPRSDGVVLVYDTT
jgi:hypothetical protein